MGVKGTEDNHDVGLGYLHIMCTKKNIYYYHEPLKSPLTSPMDQLTP